MTFNVAADAYDRFMGRYSVLLSPQLADLAAVQAGQRAIDVGCGPGALTAELATRLGPAAVAAVDPSEPFVAAARARNPGVDVQRASAEQLPFPDRDFDAALAQLVVHFIPDPAAGLAEMARVTRQGGVVAACVWDYGGGQSPLRVFWEAARELDSEVDDESELPGTREGHLAELFEAAGLRAIEATALTSSLEHRSFEEWWQPFTLGVGPAGAYAARLDAERLTELRERCRSLLPTAPFVVTATAWAMGGYGASQVYQEERLLLIPQLDDPAEIADIYGTVAWLLFHIGDFRRAVELPMGQEPGNSASGVPAVSHRTKYVFHAAAQFRLGNWDRFWSVYDRLDAAVEHDRPLGYHTMRLYGMAAYLKEVAGDRAAADALIAELDRSQASRGGIGISGARLWIVQTLVRRGLFSEARERLAVTDPVRDVQNRDLTYEAWAELIAAEETWDEAPLIVSAAREWAERTGLIVLPAFADRLEGGAALAAGDIELALDRLRRARATFERLEAGWERARTEIALADALIAAGRADEAAEVASAALATLSGLDAPVEIERAKELLARSC